MRHSFPHPSRTLLGAAISCLLVAMMPAQAATATTTFQVTATVLKACAMTTPATLAFGDYTPSNVAPLAGTTAFSVICTFGTPYSLGLSAGTSTSASVTTRKMTNAGGVTGSNLLSYGLFKEVGLSTNWDDSATGAGYTANGLTQPYTVYGSIPAGQYGAAPGNYADTITLTLTY